MAASNLVVKLLLDSGAFDKNIKTAKASIEGFEKVGKNVIGMLGKFAGALGVATTASAAIKEIMNSTKDSSIALASHIEIATSTYNNFMQAISTGDFSYAYKGWDELIKKAKSYKTAMLEAEYAHMSYQIAIANVDVGIKEAMQKSKDITLSDEERREWGKIANKRVDEAMSLTDGVNKAIEEAFGQSVAKEIPWQNYIKKEDFIEANKFSLTASQASQQAMLTRYDIISKIAQSATDKAAAEYVNGLEAEQRRKVGNPNLTFSKEDRERLKKPFIEKNRKKLEELLPQYQDAIAFKALSLMSEKELKSVQELLGVWQSVNNATTSYKEQLNEINSTATTSSSLTSSSPKVTSSKETKVEEQPLYGSLKYFSEEIAKLTKEANNINLEVDKDKYDEVMAKIKKLQLERDALLKVGTVEIPDLTDTSWMEDMEFEITPVKKEAIEKVNQLNSSLKGIADTLMVTSNLTKEGASAWLTYSANIISAIIPMLPLFSAMFSAKARLAIVDAFTKDKTGTIFGSIAGMLAITAAIAAIPKTFANGGIVDSPFGVGDRVLARVNGGEMILNKRQQSNLFNLLDNGGMAGANNKVTFEIEGKKLIGVLKNYNNKISKAL